MHPSFAKPAFIEQIKNTVKREVNGATPSLPSGRERS